MGSTELPGVSRGWTVQSDLSVGFIRFVRFRVLRCVCVLQRRGSDSSPDVIAISGGGCRYELLGCVAIERSRGVPYAITRMFAQTQTGQLALIWRRYNFLDNLLAETRVPFDDTQIELDPVVLFYTKTGAF